MGWARLLKRVLGIDLEPALRRHPEDHRRHRRAGGDRQNSHASGLAFARVTARTRAAARSVSRGLKLKPATVLH
jgi:hypothetical protein